MRLLLSTLAAGAFSLTLPLMAAEAAPINETVAHARTVAPVVQADWDGYHQEWHHHWHHEWRDDYGPDWHHRHWHRPPPPPYGYYAPPPPPPGGYVYGYSQGY